MATYSPVLGLKLNDESDPFQLSDFVGNYGILDASPGTYTCTSTSRPSWSTAQAGRLIFMTDLKQLSYWSGTSWQDLRDSAPVFAAGAYLNTPISHGASPIFNVLTFTTPRPSALSIWLTATYNFPNNKAQDVEQAVVFDGSDSVMGSYREQVRMSGDGGDSGATAGENAMSVALVPSVAAGQHKIGIRVVVSSHYPVGITLVGVKIIAMISTFASNNVL
ncbi:MAG: hypothetical protein JWM19_972 [Actinomycetia bacterium]|nr:hypothetical protein [Actinomycetes bacterium]